MNTTHNHAFDRTLEGIAVLRSQAFGSAGQG